MKGTKVATYKGSDVTAENTDFDDMAKIYVNDEFVAYFYREEDAYGRLSFCLKAYSYERPAESFESPHEAIESYLDKYYLPLWERPVPIEEILEKPIKNKGK